jgi:hypothetical protein
LFFFALAVHPAISSAGSVSGRVVDPQGQPVAGARVSVEGPLGSLGAATSDTEGRFALDAFRREWRVLVVADGFRAEPSGSPPGPRPSTPRFTCT